MAAEPGAKPYRVAKRLGIPMATLRLWMKERGLLDKPQVPDTDDPAALKARIRELERQLRDAELDNEILKKATAYFAREQK
jgi:transposase